MDSSTLMPICSITKQMLCMILKDLECNPTPEMAKRGSVRQQFSDSLDQLLRPEIMGKTGLRIAHLCNNQSGIRDYWAMSMFWGAHPDGGFKLGEDAKKTLDRTRSLHFEPGTQYAYCNLNFHVLARVVEKVSGSKLGDLLDERLFSLAGMKTATLCEDNANLPPPCVGYEGCESFGFVPATNCMQWSGDAGVVASLKDMVAYESYLDKSWDNPHSLYRAVAREQSFKDGTAARYGYGLAHGTVGGVVTIGHGGALRGFRLHRLHAPSERLSVVVMLNHQADAEEVADHILKSVLKLFGHQLPFLKTAKPSPDWVGTFFDPDAQLAVEVSYGSPGQVIVSYAGGDETLTCVDEVNGQSTTMKGKIDRDILTIHRLVDNRVVNARRVGSSQEPPKEHYIGKYRCAEIDSTFYCSGAGGMLYGAFDGFLGQGPAHLMRYLGDDIWALSCPRGLDAPAPGNWTVVFKRDGHGYITSVVIGCCDEETPPYLEYGKKLTSGWPYLHNLSDFAIATVGLLDYYSDGEPKHDTCDDINGLQQLFDGDLKTDERAGDARFQLFVVENISPQVIEKFGSRLDVGPQSFTSQLRDCTSLPFDSRQLGISRVRNPHSMFPGDWTMCRTRVAGMEAIVGTMRTRASFWLCPMDEEQAENPHRTDIDPTIQEDWPLWHYLRNWQTPPSMKEMEDHDQES
ncbi:beta-lactamase/transpeptidase-like protein [Aspergillus alliaceus]|uniref:Beta-lactamase/transpeptidase-like protein n=1 Tax=Petromyces alliaceus TaxID=209559 RepID=A0A5N7CP84_PETAA|nr:beta-lactamase/transpeptidase-like protein [Aspergillus alliaceus]